MIVAYSAGDRAVRWCVERTRRRSGRFGSADVLGPSAGRSTTLVADSNRARGGVVAWGTQDGGEEANEP